MCPKYSLKTMSVCFRFLPSPFTSVTFQSLFCAPDSLSASTFQRTQLTPELTKNVHSNPIILLSLHAASVILLERVKILFQRWSQFLFQPVK